MNRIIAVPLEGGSTMLVESDERSGPITRGGGGSATIDVIDTAATSLEAAMDGIAPASQAIVSRLRGSGDRGPSEIVIEFGLVVRAEAGLVVARAGGEANFSVRVTWQRDG